MDIYHISRIWTSHILLWPSNGLPVDEKPNQTFMRLINALNTLKSRVMHNRTSSKTQPPSHTRLEFPFMTPPQFNVHRSKFKVHQSERSLYLELVEFFKKWNAGNILELCRLDVLSLSLIISAQSLNWLVVLAWSDRKSFVHLHPHLPRQLHWSLEYCAAAPHRSTAVIQSAVHGRSMVACPHRRTPDPAQQTHQTSEPRAPLLRTASSDQKISPRAPFSARAGYMAGSPEACVASEAENQFDERFL